LNIYNTFWVRERVEVKKKKKERGGQTGFEKTLLARKSGGRTIESGRPKSRRRKVTLNDSTKEKRNASRMSYLHTYCETKKRRPEIMGEDG